MCGRVEDLEIENPGRKGLENWGCWEGGEKLMGIFKKIGYTHEIAAFPIGSLLSDIMCRPLVEVAHPQATTPPTTHP